MVPAGNVRCPPDDLRRRREPMGKNLLISGVPGVGKTTLLVSLARSLANVQMTGFITREIRADGTRKGFELVSCSGDDRVLAHADLQHPHRVGKYSVDIGGFEEFLQGIPLLSPGAGLIVIDEIGKMECISPVFQETVLQILDSDQPFIATIAKRGTPFIDRIRQRRDVLLVEVTLKNRDSIHRDLLAAARNMLEP